MIDKPHVDWFAISPSLAMLAAAGLLPMIAASVPAGPFRAVASHGAGFVAAFVFGVLVDARARARRIVARLLRRDLGGHRPGR